LGDEQTGGDDQAKRHGALDYVLGGLILVASFIAGTVPSQHKSNSNKDNPNSEIAKWTRVVGRWTRGMVIVGVLTVGVLSLQAWAFIQSERAYLIVDRFAFDGGLTPDKQIALGYMIKNTGRSAAEITDTSVSIGAVLHGYDRLKEVNENPIPAGGESVQLYKSLKLDGSPNILSQSDIDEIKSGKIKFYVYGFIEYRDDFSILGKRKNFFCYIYLPDRSSQNASAFGGCPIH
jgi:hypothetical protein